jgi:hypothetical protein
MVPVSGGGALGGADCANTGDAIDIAAKTPTRVSVAVKFVIKIFMSFSGA